VEGENHGRGKGQFIPGSESLLFLAYFSNFEKIKAGF
jgi:hypothetical protein